MSFPRRTTRVAPRGPLAPEARGLSFEEESRRKREEGKERKEEAMSQYKYLLSEKELPDRWYNVLADMSASGGPLPPPVHPATHEPIGPEALAPLFPMALIEQEGSTERYIAIPDEVLEIYKLWRPTPLFRAHRLERSLDTPARIYYKYEGVSPAGSHKPNT